MMLELVDTPVVPYSSAGHFRPRGDNRPRARLANTLRRIDEAGTGGVSKTASPWLSIGYVVLFSADAPAYSPAEVGQYAAMMQEVKSAFGRTMSHLPGVFGVSRQTLYNWLRGEIPKAVYQDRIRELAQAALVFKKEDFKPTPVALERGLLQGKSFLQLLAEGADGAETAQKLVRVERRAAMSRSRLDAMLGGQRARPDAADMGVPAFNEKD